MGNENLQIDKNSRNVLGAIDKDTGEIKYVGMDADSRGLHMNMWVWDTGTTAWARMTQPVVEFSGDLTVTMGDIEALLADNYYKRMKPYTHASGRVKYLCKNTDIDANTTDTDWIIWKYGDSDIPEIEGPRTGAVNTEGVVDALSWNI